jgi:hypothetical protein
MRLISKWAWAKEINELNTLYNERDEMLKGLEKCGWTVYLLELPEYCYKLSAELISLQQSMKPHKE